MSLTRARRTTIRSVVPTVTELAERVTDLAECRLPPPVVEHLGRVLDVPAIRRSTATEKSIIRKGSPDMTLDNPLADKLLNDARRKTARLDNPTMTKAALIVGIVAALTSPVSIAGWVFGVAAIGLAVPGAQRPLTAQHAKIAITLGVVAILIGTFFFTLNIASWS